MFCSSAPVIGLSIPVSWAVSRAAVTERQERRAALTGRQWSEFMLKLETAGLESKLAQRVIESKGRRSRLLI